MRAGNLEGSELLRLETVGAVLDALELYGRGNGGKQFRRCFGFSYYLIIFYGIFGVSIIPKWLIKVPGHIPIFF